MLKIQQVANGYILTTTHPREDAQVVVVEAGDFDKEPVVVRKLLYAVMEELGISFNDNGLHLRIQLIDHEGNEIND